MTTQPENTPPKRYVANRIPKTVRYAHVASSAVILLFGGIAIACDAFLIPLTRRDAFIIHGPAIWVMGGALLCAIANLMSVVYDHYDVRDNEMDYRRFAKRSRILGWVLFFASIVLNVILFGDGAFL